MIKNKKTNKFIMPLFVLISAIILILNIKNIQNATIGLCHFLGVDILSFIIVFTCLFVMVGIPLILTVIHVLLCVDGFLSKLSKIEVNENYINLALISSEKEISEKDLNFIRENIPRKENVEWYESNKTKEINEGKRIFSLLLLDTLIDYDIIKNFFNDEENKLGFIDRIHTEGYGSWSYNEFEKNSLSNYLKINYNYFKINNKFYLKELVFYILTNKTIKVEELYNFMSQRYSRTDICFSISKLISMELESNKNLALTSTLEEAVNIYNDNYKTDLSLGFVKNIIYLGNFRVDEEYLTELKDKTTLLNELINPIKYSID